MNALQTLVSERMAELGLTYRQAAAKAGRQVSHATLNAIVVGRHSWRLDDSTIAGIALALDVDEDRVREAAGQVTDERERSRHFELPPRADRLNDEGRRAVVALIDALLRAADSEPVDREDDRRRRASDRVST